jgi:signal peptidase II
MVIPSSRRLDQLWTFFAPLVVIFLGADQLTKDWAVSHLKNSDPTDLGLSLIYNNGVVFGFDLPLVAIYLLTVGILALGTYLVIKQKLWRDRWHLTGLAFLLSGALGNLIDRLRFGYVIDFIKVYWWPVFNLADVWIVLGVLVFAWQFLFREDGLEKL